MNTGCALSALVLLPQRSAATAPVPKAHALRTKLRWLLFASGLLGVGFEVAALRVLCQVTENTVYTFAICLAVYLAGTAAGAALFHAWPGRTDDASQRDRLLVLAALGCGLGAAALCWSAPLAPLLAQGAGISAALGLELALAALAFIPPTLAFGALFSQLCLEARHNGQSLGRALAMNTWGAALAPLLFGVGVVPTLGPCAGLALVALGYALLLRPASFCEAPTRRVLRVCLPAALACAGLALASPAQRGRYGLQDGELVRHEEGVSASVSVVRSSAGVSTLHIDHRQQEGSDATLYADARQAWLPLLLHPQPRRALFLGLGTGLSAGAAAWDPALEVDAVELLPEVARASADFRHALHSARGPQIWLADARRFVRAAPAPYDVIVSDLFHPARSGSGALYTVEHFRAVSQQLTAAGVFCQWLPLHQLDLTSLRSIVASFLTVYPRASALLATSSLDTPVLGLIGTRARAIWPLSALGERVRRSERPARLAALQLDDALAVLGSFVSGPAALARFAGAAPRNTDDRPIVAYRAPFATYAPRDRPRDRLMLLVRSLQVAPRDVLGATPDAGSAQRLARYWSARDRFLALGMRVRPGASGGELLAQVRAPLLDILRESPEFRPAYDPLLSMARALSAGASAEALPLLRELAAVQPARPEAQELLRRATPADAQP